METHLQVSTAHFRFAPDILRRLGEELNPSLDQGILELVKNSYDADASSCTVQLHETDAPGGEVRVTDDGVGMTSDDIRGGWLVLGKSVKAPHDRTARGRAPAGSKGLGRLAALRLGTTATLLTRPTFEPDVEYSLRIDWAAFDAVDLVDDVPLTITKHSRPQGRGQGSDVILEGLRARISRMDAKRLARSLILLADPFGTDPSGFQPNLAAPEYADLEALVRNRYFTDADYHLAATVGADGHGTATVTDWQGQTLFQSNHSELATARGSREYQCPPASFDLWVFLLTRTSFASRPSSLEEVRAWLQAFGGVHLYLNGLRVAPYGNPSNDWLDMNLRRAQSPEERPSTNTSIGRLSVLDPAGSLLQKTDRSGFIEDVSFAELRGFAKDALEWMARRRLDAALLRRATARQEAPERSQQSRDGVQKAIEAIPANARTSVKEAFEAYDRSRERQVKDLRKEVQLYRTLSTAGITAATFAHESTGNAIKVVTQSIKAIERRARKALGKAYDDLLKSPVDGILKSIEALAVLGNAILHLVDHEKRRIGRVDVHTVIHEVIETFTPFLEGRDVTIRKELYDGEPYLRATPAAIESIVSNLLNNSLAAFERIHPGTRTIVIRTAVNDRVLDLRVLDNGPGIEGISKRDIWLPGVTTKPNGTGLGLAIVRDTVRDLGGDVDATEHGSLGGAEIIIRIPVLGG
jgi:C4-dicarboxylate-specific signal transduction histidine kinase